MKKILVIDDEKPTLSMSRLLLGALGYSVLTAENAAVGLELFNAENPPIVLTDIKMPGMNGLTLLKQMKTIDPNVQVIVVTGHGDMELAKEAMTLQATDFLHKPIRKEALEAALKKAESKLP